MSRRHHGRPHHGRHRGAGPRPDAGTARPAAPAPDAAPAGANAPVVSAQAAQPVETAPVAHENGATAAPTAPGHVNGYTNGHAPPSGHAQTNGHAQQDGHGGGAANGTDRPSGCTAPQLRRFIKSRPYVPMHELRRRFAIDGNDDDVTQVDLEGSRVYVGLPEREGSLLGELLRGGEIGYELSFDPLAPIVVGVYPMRPVPRS